MRCEKRIPAIESEVELLKKIYRRNSASFGRLFGQYKRIFYLVIEYVIERSVEEGLNIVEVLSEIGLRPSTKWVLESIDLYEDYKHGNENKDWNAESVSTIVNPFIGKIIAKISTITDGGDLYVLYNSSIELFMSKAELFMSK